MEMFRFKFYQNCTKLEFDFFEFDFFEGRGGAGGEVGRGQEGTSISKF